MRALASFGLMALVAIPAVAVVRTAEGNMADMSPVQNADSAMDPRSEMNASLDSAPSDQPFRALRPLGTGDGAAYLYLDLAGRAWADGRRQLWTRIFSRSAPPGAPAGTWQVRQQYEIDCAARRFEPLATRYFDRDDRELGDFPVADAPNFWPAAARDALIDQGCDFADEVLREVADPAADARARLAG